MHKMTITAKGGLTVGDGGIMFADLPTVDVNTLIEIENTSAVGDDLNEGAGYLRIHPDATDIPEGVVANI